MNSIKEIKGLVTYVMPCYNQGKFVEEAIKSIIDQDYDRIELIVIDDGSTDNTSEIVSSMESVCSSRFDRFSFVSRENRGFVYSLNEGLNWANGEFFSLLASDDVLLPFKTTLMYQLLSKELDTVVAVYGGVEVIDEFGSHVRDIIPKRGYYCFEDIFLKKCPYQTPTQLIKTSALRGINGFDSNFVSEDWIMLLNLTVSGNTIKITEDQVTKYRRHGENMSKKIELNHNYRLAVLDKFKYHLLYPRAKARVHAGHASEVSDIDIRRALNNLAMALSCYPAIIFDKKFRRAFLSILRSIVGIKNDHN